MNKMEWIAPCHFGLESVLKREIQDLGYEISQVEDGRVTFYGEADAACRANIFLRTAERVLLKVGSFKAVTFDELFEKTKALPWEAYIPKDGKFWVAKASSVKSKLFSPSDIQSIMKKAMVERLKSKYRIQWFQEDGASYPLRVFLMKDIVTIGIDTSGDSLHKRGYRPAAGKAPISETLAAALIMLTPWKADRILVDAPCSGLGILAKKPDLRYKKLEAARQAELLATQAAILDTAAALLKAGGRLVYSTCTIDPAENQQQIAAFLQRHPEFAVCAPDVSLPAGMTAGEHGCLSVPTRTGMDGFFLCAMQKNGEKLQ